MPVRGRRERNPVEVGRGCPSDDSAAGISAVHRQLRGHKHERGDYPDRQGSGHDGGRGADGDHAVHADDGGADDPGQQADRYLGPQALLRDRPGCLRGGRHTGGAVTGTPAADHRLLAAGGRGLGADDSAHLHPGHGDLPRRQVTGPARSGPKPRFDLTGAVLSAAGLFFVVLGLLQSRTYGFGKSRQDFIIGGTVVIPKGSISPVWLFVAIGALFLLWFFLHVRSSEKKGKDVLLPLRLFRNKVANLGLGTQTIQWLILQGSFFTVSVYLQEVWKYNAIQTGLMLTPATVGILAASAAAGRFARRHPQRWLIIAGFLV